MWFAQGWMGDGNGNLGAFRSPSAPCLNFGMTEKAFKNTDAWVSTTRDSDLFHLELRLDHEPF